MSLIKNALFKSATMMVVLAAALIILARLSLGIAMTELETELAMQSGRQALSALERDIEELDTNNSDWAQWDDTYNYVQDHNQTYVESNLVDSTFENNHWNLVIFYDSSGNIVYSRGYSWSNHKGQKIAEEIPKYFAEMIQTRGLKKTRGLIESDDQLFIVSANPVLTSDGQTGPNGLLVIGRTLDIAEIGRLEKYSELNLSLQPYSSDSSLFTLAAGEKIAVVPFDNKLIQAFIPLTTLDSKQPFMLQVDISRAPYSQGRSAIVVFIAGLLALALLGGLAVLYALYKDVLGPLRLLTTNVGQIGLSPDSAARIEFEGPDEMQTLASDINAMLDRLEESSTSQQNSRRTLEEKNQQLQFLFSNMDQGFLAFGEDLLVYPESSAACLRILGQEPVGKEVGSLLFSGAADQASEWAGMLKKAVQEENPEKAAYYLNIMPADLIINDRALRLYYRLASGFKSGFPSSVAVFIDDISDLRDIEEQLIKERTRMDMLWAVLGDARGFAELIDQYIYYYTKELPGQYDNLETSEQVEAAARQITGRLDSFAELFNEYQLSSATNSLTDLSRQMNSLLEQGGLELKQLTALASPEALEALLQTELVIIERYLGEDLMRI